MPGLQRHEFGRGLMVGGDRGSSPPFLSLTIIHPTSWVKVWGFGCAVVHRTPHTGREGVRWSRQGPMRAQETREQPFTEEVRP